MSAFKKGTVVISVDDGRIDAYRFFKEILEPYNMPATFNIVTDLIKEKDKQSNSAISREEFDEMAKSVLIEIAGHGHTHQNTDEDIIKGRELICEWIGKDEKIGFASPYSQMKSDYVSENEERLSNMGFLYVRSADDLAAADERHLQVIENAKKKGCGGYVVGHIPKMAFEFKGMFVNSVVVLFNTEVNDIKRLTEIAVQEKACVVIMFHSVKKMGEVAYDNAFSYDYDKTKELVEYWDNLRSDGVLDIMTNKDAYAVGLTLKS